MGLDLVDVSRRGIAEGKDRPELSLYGWAMSALDSEGREWDESAIHVSDYKVILKPDDRMCERQLWHRLNGDERKDGSLWRDVMFDQGDAMHTRFSYYINLGLPDDWKVFGIEVSCEDYLPDDDDVGSADLVIWKPDSKDFLIIEIKSQRGRGIQRIKSNDEPKRSHKLQCQGYLYALERRFNEEYENADVDGCVLYLDREGQNPPISFHVEPDDGLIEQASHLANNISYAANAPEKMQLGVKVSRNKTTDDSLYLDVPWQCQYCDYRGVSCEGAISEDKEYTNKIGELDDDGNVTITADVDDADYYESLLQESVNAGEVTEK